MATVNLQATPRTGLGKEKARKLRQAELIPAIIYGHATEPTPVTISELDFRTAMSTSAGSRAVIRLDIEGEKSTKVALVKAVQRHPVTHRVMHADLLTIDLDQTVDVNVPISGQGVPEGVRLEDGVLGWARRELAIRVKPMQIPESIEIDISELHVGQAVHVSDIATDAGYEILDDADLTICSVATTRIVEEETVAEGEEVEGEELAEGEEAPKADGEADSE